MRRMSSTSTSSNNDDERTEINPTLNQGAQIENVTSDLSVSQANRQQQLLRQDSEMSMSYQIHFLQQQKEDLAQQSAAYQDLLEAFSTANESNRRFKQKVDELNNRYSKEKSKNNKIKDQVEIIKSKAKTLGNEQNERDISFGKKVQMLKSVIKQDQQSFAAKEVEHEQILVQLQEQKERNKHMEKKIAAAMQERKNSSFEHLSDPKRGKNPRVSELKHRVNRLKLELVSLHRVEEQRLRLIKKYQKEHDEYTKTKTSKYRKRRKSKRAHEASNKGEKQGQKLDDISLCDLEIDDTKTKHTTTEILYDIEFYDIDVKESKVSQPSQDSENKTSAQRLGNGLAKRLNGLATR